MGYYNGRFDVKIGFEIGKVVLEIDRVVKVITISGLSEILLCVYIKTYISFQKEYI